MKRRALNFIVVCLAMLSMTAMSHAVTYVVWDGSAGDSSWLTGANWSTGAIPPNSSAYYARVQMTAGPIVTAGQTASVYRIYLDGATNGTMTMNGGTVNVTNHVYLAAAGTDRGTLNMNGGSLNIGASFYFARDPGSIGAINLSGGTITCATLYFCSNGGGGDGTLNIEDDGKLIYTTLGTGTPAITTLIQTGRIQAYDGLGIVKVDTTTQPGKTIVSAIMTTKAQIPSPSEGAADLVYNSTTLGWKAGMTAVSHDVYLGTSLADVNNALPFAGDLDFSGIVDFKDLSILTGYWLLDPTGTDPFAGTNDDSIVDLVDYSLLSDDWKDASIFKGNQDANTFDPGNLVFDTTYYWRVDEVNGLDTFKGDVWSFKIHSGKAGNVTPMEGDLNARSKSVLAWTAAPEATSHDVYFGTANPPPFIGNQTATTYNPGVIANSTTFYWRIDEKYSIGTVTGDVWTFTTMSAETEPDLVFIHASDPQMNWNNCNGNGIDNLLWGTTIELVNILNPDFMIVTGDLVNSSTSDPEVALYKGFKTALNPTIECYETPGNHDMGEPPNQAKYDRWAANYGYSPNPWYSFEFGNNFFICIDSTVLAQPFSGKDVEQLTWLSTTLADANDNGYDHIFAFTHYGWTADKWVGTTALANKAQLSALFNQYHVTAVFAGHTHYDAISTDGTVEWITSGSCTCNLGSPRPDPGIRIIKVYADRIEQESRTLNSLPVGSANIKKGPYLIYPNNNTQMTVLWQVDASTSSCNIQWGTDTTYSLGRVYTTQYGTDHQHKYTITGLTPGTKYYYRVNVSGTPYTGTFTAAPASDATNVKFFMYGDTRTNAGSHNALCSRMVSDYGSDPAYQTMVLHAGDWVSASYLKLRGQLSGSIPIIQPYGYQDCHTQYGVSWVVQEITNRIAILQARAVYQEVLAVPFVNRAELITRTIMVLCM